MSESDRAPGPALDAFDAVYQQQLDYVWRTLGRLGVAQSDLADAAHDVFVIVYRRWSDIDQDRPIRPWLFGVARKVAANRRRRDREVLGESPSEQATSDDQFASRDLLWRALSALSDDRREVFVLHDLEGYTGLEIAELLHIPANTVHSRLRLARADLVAILERLRGPR